MASDLSKCPFCGGGLNPLARHDPLGLADWACGSFQRGPKANQSVDCKLAVAEARVAELEAERDAALEQVAELRKELRAAVLEIYEHREFAPCWMPNFGPDEEGDCGNWDFCEELSCPLKRLGLLAGITPQKDGGIDHQGAVLSRQPPGGERAAAALALADKVPSVVGGGTTAHCVPCSAPLGQPHYAGCEYVAYQAAQGHVAGLVGEWATAAESEETTHA